MFLWGDLRNTRRFRAVLARAVGDGLEGCDVEKLLVGLSPFDAVAGCAKAFGQTVSGPDIPKIACHSRYR